MATNPDSGPAMSRAEGTSGGQMLATQGAVEGQHRYTFAYLLAVAPSSPSQ